MAMNEDIKTGEQLENSKVPEQLRPYQYRKGQSGNPSGRPKGISLKEYAKMKFLTMTDDEKEEFFHGLNKDIIWEMGEGRPETKGEMKVIEELNAPTKDLKTVKSILGLGDKATDSPSA